VDLTLESILLGSPSNLIDQTSPHPIQSFPSNTITVTSISWHPTESILALTLSSGALLLTRIIDRSDGEKIDHEPRGMPGDLVTNGFHHYDDYNEEENDVEDPSRYDMTFEDSFASRRGEEMIVDEEE
jgi:hypothetical protein